MQHLTTDQLLIRVQSLFKIRDIGEIAGKTLTPLGYDWIDKELMAIDHELDQRKPEDGPICVGQAEEDMTGILPYPLTINIYGNIPKFRNLFCGSEVVGFEVAL